MHTIDSDNINLFLKGFGKADTGEQRFRLVWSDEQLELRSGTFNEFYGKIFLREVKGVREVPKYNYLKERWVLEQFYPGYLTKHEDLPLSDKGSYEPIYVFEDRWRRPLPLNKRVVEIIMKSKFAPPRTSKDIKAEDQIAFDARDVREQNYIEDYLDTSAMQSNLHFGEGIIVPSNYPEESPNLRGKE